MIFGPPNQEPRLEDLSLLLHYRNPQISSAPMTLKPACQSAPTTFTAHPTTLQGHTYDLLTRMSGVHLRPSPPEIRILKVTPTTLKLACQEPSQLYLLPFKVTPTTCKPACQERTYNPHRMTYDPSRSHLRPSNPHVRSTPTTLTALPMTLQGHTYGPPTACQEATTTLFALWPNTKVLPKARGRRKG